MKAFKARNASVLLIFIFTALLAIALMSLSADTSGERAIEADRFDPMPNGTYIGNPFVAGGSPLNPQDFPFDLMACPDNSEAPDSGVDILSETTSDETTESKKEGDDAPVDHVDKNDMEQNHTHNISDYTKE